MTIHVCTRTIDLPFNGALVQAAQDTLALPAGVPGEMDLYFHGTFVGLAGADEADHFTIV